MSYFADNKQAGNETYRQCYKRLYLERRRARVDCAVLRRLRIPGRFVPPGNQPRVPEGIVPPIFPRPRLPDPDLPQGPGIGPDVIDPNDPFPGFPPLQGPRMDPFGGGELMPSRPTRPQGVPRFIPPGQGFEDPNRPLMQPPGPGDQFPRFPGRSDPSRNWFG